MKILHYLRAFNADVSMKFPIFNSANTLGHIRLRSGTGDTAIPHIFGVRTGSKIFNSVIVPISINVINALGPILMVQKKHNPMSKDCTVDYPNLRVSPPSTGIAPNWTKAKKSPVFVNKSFQNFLFLFRSYWSGFHNMVGLNPPLPV